MSRLNQVWVAHISLKHILIEVATCLVCDTVIQQRALIDHFMDLSYQLFHPETLIDPDKIFHPNA